MISLASRRLVAPLVAVTLLACAGERRAQNQNTDQDRYAREVASAVPTIEKITGLRFKQPPAYKVRTKAEVRAFVDKMFNEEKPARDLAAQQTVFRRLGVIPDTLDLRRLMLDLLSEQMVGFYDPKTKVLYIVEDAPMDQVEFVVQHELVHALQDQYMNLDSLLNLKGDDDRALAAQSVMEGQAMLVPIQAMLGPGAQLPGGWDRARDLIRESQASMPVMARTPEFMQELIIFPYLSGAEFVRRFQERSPGRLPYGKDLPTSSTQIMHARAYFDSPRQLPLTIALPTPRVGTATYDNDMGEFATRVMLYQVLRDQNEAVRAAEGWAGDRYTLLRMPEGDGLAWLTVFDTPVDAAEFAQALQDLAAKRYPGAVARKSGMTTRFEAAKRTIAVWGGEVGGHAAVLYIDVPAGARTDLFDLSKVHLN